MKTVKLPLLRADMSTHDAISTLIEYRAPAAVVSTGEAHRLVWLTDIVPSRGRVKRGPLAAIKHVELDPEALGPMDLATVWADVKLTNDYFVRYDAPLYVCPKGDDHDSRPRNCSIHIDLALVRVKDEDP